MKRFFLLFFILVSCGVFLQPNYSYGNEERKTALTKQVLGNGNYSSNSKSLSTKPIQAFDRLIIRLNELFNMAKEFIYLLSAFILMKYIHEWIQEGKGFTWEHATKLAWFMLALAILGMVRDLAEFAVGGDVEFISEIEQRHYEETGEQISIMSSTIK